MCDSRHESFSECLTVLLMLWQYMHRRADQSNDMRFTFCESESAFTLSLPDPMLSLLDPMLGNSLTVLQHASKGHADWNYAK